ncbi:FAD binding domain-containing protein [Fusarium heterosporum]|uniref:FAD binding domain-containing protein n=1 Tax=Fusarium heterosporum TaxID=42747 RepID=A0A8H5WF09_FUSHE|nr:FAD binding domain-containing protein [Fusarium heterosporum]
MPLSIVWLLSLSADAWSVKPSACCLELCNIPQQEGKVHMPYTTACGQRLDTYYFVNAALEPLCIVLPTNTQDVSAIARVLSENECRFGVRSGAHSVYRGTSSVEDGITVDFGHMSLTIYDDSRKLASVGPGSTWGQTYNALNMYRVAAIKGRASPVGVDGFMTGEGYSFHGQHKKLCLRPTCQF